ncbi:hypothetical protein VOLCADRAFT_91894 [Volvox carteri f. nagariensis]|uniref:Uncharacterized protein n=1 Tax=Volvox carteri f. nagariensis TaxID=3068 RepID=D8TY85_VOLCA|nr:uncharacterized protein VOLCADRAFT_91894 [Volvox carteri f. nagariensis]EFJ47506.1 hypothetical protein VOLCADRAFT_91894 [Volvox carteri f. nagariensis]|eukprot:XP_002951330.1 hypothetical protein VOLCADRAFT_91894 [Volvox carteri f. nagariensis]
MTQATNQHRVGEASAVGSQQEAVGGDEVDTNNDDPTVGMDDNNEHMDIDDIHTGVGHPSREALEEVIFGLLGNATNGQDPTQQPHILTQLSSMLEGLLRGQLIREAILLTPWTEYLAVRRTVSPNMGGRPCDPACYTGSSSKVAQALQAAGLLPTPPDAARSTSANSSTGISTSSSSSGGSSGGTASLQDYCDSCGPPLWVVPEHLALGVDRQQMSQMQIHGYRLQMILKLTVSSLISTRHYLVMDSDVLMVRHVGPQQAHWLFPEPGKALYQPQRRVVHHRWWNTTEAVLGLGGCLSADPDTSVFGVTPALLATDISASVSRYWDEHLGGGSRLRALGELLPRRRPFLTEYCSYHLVAECVMGNGTMNEYHALPRHRRLLSNGASVGNRDELEGENAPPVLYRGLWQSGSWSKPGGRATVCKDCVFLVVQSDTGVPEDLLTSQVARGCQRSKAPWLVPGIGQVAPDKKYPLRQLWSSVRTCGRGRSGTAAGTRGGRGCGRSSGGRTGRGTGRVESNTGGGAEEAWVSGENDVIQDEDTTNYDAFKEWVGEVPRAAKGEAGKHRRGGGDDDDLGARSGRKVGNKRLKGNKGAGRGRGASKGTARVSNAAIGRITLLAMLLGLVLLLPGSHLSSITSSGRPHRRRIAYTPSRQQLVITNNVNSIISDRTTSTSTSTATSTSSTTATNQHRVGEASAVGSQQEAAGGDEVGAADVATDYYYYTKKDVNTDKDKDTGTEAGGHHTTQDLQQPRPRLLHQRTLDGQGPEQQVQQQNHQLPQLTILLLTTFKDIGRALMSITSVKTHLAPELIREGILLTPWTEYLSLRRTVSPNMGGRPCDPACYTGSSSKVAQALQAAGLLPTPPDAARSTSANSSTGISTSSSSSGGSSGGTASLQDYCDSCGPPLWVVPEHLALGVERQQMSQIDIYNYRLQMILKLTVSSLISTRHYLVMDSDVLMVRHVGPQQAHWLFPEPGKALYQPQRRVVHHRWWNATEAVLGLGGCLPTHPETRVFGVTPALLATDISASAARYWDEHLGGGSRLRALGELLPRRRPFLTEYCSYHLVAECVMGNGTMNEYHALPRHRRLLHTAGGGGNGGDDDTAPPPVLYRGLWRNGSWLQPGGRATTCKDCIFLVVQSNAGVSESRVVGDLEEVFA